MDDSTFFVVKSDEDGTAISGPYTRAALLKLLDEHFWGENTGFLNHIPEANGGYWRKSDNKLLVICGEIVIPKAVETVRKFSV